VITNPVADNISNPQRVFLRVPMKLSATVIVEGKPYKKVSMLDLSSTGLALFTAEDKDFPSVFDLRFRLGRFSRPVTINMEVKNRTPLGDGVRIGCIFRQVSKKAQNLINNYIDRLLNFTVADDFIFMAAFLCFIDVLWKLAARLINGYYIGTEFGRSAGMYKTNPFSEAAFVCYAIASFIIVFIVAHRASIKGKPRFIASITLLTAIFVYLSWKNISCIQYKLWNTECLIAKAGFWWEIFLNFCLAASIIICIAFLRKISSTFKIIRTHTKGEFRRS
jgi:hypothetical protein